MEQTVLSINDDKMTTRGELIEYPAELIGGRNLIVRHNEIKNTLINIPGDIILTLTASTMSTYIPVTEGDVYTFSKNTDSSPDGNYFRWRWFDENENYISRTANGSNNSTWIVPSGAHFIQVSYPNSEEAKPKLEKGNKASDWTPAPEDLGLSYPDWVMEFKPSISENGILSPEFDESGVLSFSINRTTAQEFIENTNL